MIKAKINEEKYNNWKQICIENQEKEIEKKREIRRNEIMDQLNMLSKQKEMEKNKEKVQEEQSLAQKPINLNLESNLASKKITYKINVFAYQMQNKLNIDQKKAFNNYIAYFLAWLEKNEELIKGFMSDSIAQVILYLVCGTIGVSKIDFISNLKPNVKSNRNKPKVENIKKLLCYPILKKAL